MSEEALLELVSAASDGELDLRQQAEVERRLRDSVLARRFLADLEHLDTLMSSLPERAVPDAVHARIMAAAGAVIREPAPRRATRLPDLVLRYGLGAAAGALLTLAVYELQPTAPDAADYGELAGTMISADDRGGVHVLTHETISLRELSGRIELQQRRAELQLDIRVDAAETVDLEVDFTDAGMRPVGIVQHRVPFESVEIAGRLLNARGSGRHEMSVSLRRAEDAAVADEAVIRLEYSSNGRVLKQGTLSATVE